MNAANVKDCSISVDNKTLRCFFPPSCRGCNFKTRTRSDSTLPASDRRCVLNNTAAAWSCRANVLTSQTCSVL